MTLYVHLLGRPRLERSDGDAYTFRSRKSWALLAYLLLGERPPTRTQLSAMLFAEADDPLRALRWSLSEIRRGLDADGSVDGDPMRLALGDNCTVDATVVLRGRWQQAVVRPGLGADFLDGIELRGAAAFDSWLLAERHRLSAASEAVLHEAALGSMSVEDLDAAVGYAARASAMNPLDESHHELLIRLYALSGDTDAARRQFSACADVLASELGVTPGPAVEAALGAAKSVPEVLSSAASIGAVLEAGQAAVSAGAIEAGIASLRSAVNLADRSAESGLQVSCRLVLSEALVHSLRGFDEEGLASLHAADEIARDIGDSVSAGTARAELGYVDFLRGRYDRAALWLSDAATFASDSPRVVAKSETYLGSVESDRAHYEKALAVLEQAAGRCRQAGDARMEAYARSMSGRVHLLCGALDDAEEDLEAACRLADGDHWLAFLPWPQALLGEVRHHSGDTENAEALLQQAFARACQIGDPCWEGAAARGLARIAEASGSVDEAFDLLADARRRTDRHSDGYVWLDARILDDQCELGRRYWHPDTDAWIDALRDISTRSGMRELTVRALVHGAARGRGGDADMAAILVEEIDNPELPPLVGSVSAAG